MKSCRRPTAARRFASQRLLASLTGNWNSGRWGQQRPWRRTFLCMGPPEAPDNQAWGRHAAPEPRRGTNLLPCATGFNQFRVAEGLELCPASSPPENRRMSPGHVEGPTNQFRGRRLSVRPETVGPPSGFRQLTPADLIFPQVLEPRHRLALDLDRLQEHPLRPYPK